MCHTTVSVNLCMHLILLCFCYLSGRTIHAVGHSASNTEESSKASNMGEIHSNKEIVDSNL